MRHKSLSKILINAFFIIASLIFVFPFFVIVMNSFACDSDILRYGYSIIPREFTLTAYKVVFSDMSQMAKAFAVTFYSAFAGATLTVIVNAMAGYALCQKAFAYRKAFTVYIIFTMLFSGGIVVSYIINTKYFNLSNNLLVYIIGVASAWNIVLFRTFFSQISPSLVEAAKIDGATEFQTFINVILPMSKPIMTVVFFNNAMGRWNEWETSLYYMSDRNLYTIQHMMQNVLRESEFIRQTYLANPMFASSGEELPLESLRFAMCVIATIPVFAFFPFVQKNFAKGVAIGSVKE